MSDLRRAQTLEPGPYHPVQYKTELNLLQFTTLPFKNCAVGEYDF